MCGTIVSQLPIFIDAVNCNNVPTFHIYYLDQIKQCLDIVDKQNRDYIDISNIVLLDKINRLETRVTTLETTIATTTK